VQMNNHNKGTTFQAHDIDADEWKAVVGHCTRLRTGARDRCLITLAYRCGLRSAEVCGLKLADVNLDAGKYGLLTVLGKGGRQRELALNSDASVAIRSWVAIRKSDSPYLFPTSKGKPLDTSYLRRLLPRLAKAAGITKRVHPHAARHTFADTFHKRTNNVKLVQVALGHSSLATTDAYLSERKAQQQMLDAMAGS
jgi:integrase